MVDKAYMEDVKKQLLAGIKDVRKMAEKTVDLNAKAAETATQIAAQAVQIRKTLAIDEEAYRSASDENSGMLISYW